MNCIKIGLPGKSILRDYFQENRYRSSGRPFPLLRISFPGRPISIQLVPASHSTPTGDPKLFPRMDGVLVRSLLPPPCMAQTPVASLVQLAQVPHVAQAQSTVGELRLSYEQS